MSDSDRVDRGGVQMDGESVLPLYSAMRNTRLVPRSN